MAKTIELIDEYIIQQSEDTDYNPPSYIWHDNKGELIRCGKCVHADGKHRRCKVLDRKIDEDDYCSWAERREE